MLARTNSVLVLQMVFATRLLLVHGFVPCLQRRILLAPSAFGVRRSMASSSATRLLMASIVDDVTAEMKTAMKAKDTLTLSTVRLIRSAFANAAIEIRAEKLTDEQAQAVLKKLAKMRRESIEMFEKGGAMDRADLERAELSIIERWLPAAVSDDTVRVWAQEAIAEAGPDNMGKVMGAFMKKHKADNVDGGLVQKIVKEELAKLTK